MKKHDKKKTKEESQTSQALIYGDLAELEPLSPLHMQSIVGGAEARSKIPIMKPNDQVPVVTPEIPSAPDYHAEAEAALTEKHYVQAAEDFEKADTKHDELNAGNAWSQAASESANSHEDRLTDLQNAANDWHSGTNAYRQAAESATSLTQAARDYEGEGNGFVDIGDGAHALKAYKDAASALESIQNATTADHQSAFDIESKIIDITETHGNGLSYHNISRHLTQADALDAQATILSQEGGTANLAQAGALFELSAKALGGDLLAADENVLASTVEYDKAGKAWSAAAQEAGADDKAQDFANASLDFRSAGDVKNEAASISSANLNGYQGFITEAAKLEKNAEPTDQEQRLLTEIDSQQQALTNVDNNSLYQGASWEILHNTYEHSIETLQAQLTSDIVTGTRTELKTESADFEQAAMDLQGSNQVDQIDQLQNHIGDIHKQLAELDKTDYDADAKAGLQNNPLPLMQQWAMKEASDADKAALAYAQSGNTLAQASMLQVEKDALTALGQDLQTTEKAADEVGQTAGDLYLKMAKTTTVEAEQLTLYTDAEKALMNTFDRADLAKAETHIGQIEAAEGNFDKAGKAYSDAGSEDVTYAQATSDFENSGKSYDEAGKFEHAAAAYSNAASVDLANKNNSLAVKDYETAGSELNTAIQKESGLAKGEQVSAYQAEANAYQNAGAINANLGHNTAAASDFQNALAAVNAAKSLESADEAHYEKNWMKNHAGGGDTDFDKAMNAMINGTNDAIHDTVIYVEHHEWPQMVLATAVGIGAGMLAAPYIAVAGLAVGGAVGAGVDAGADVLARAALESGIVVATSPAADAASTTTSEISVARLVEEAVLKALPADLSPAATLPASGGAAPAAVSEVTSSLGKVLEDAIENRLSQIVASRPRIEVKAGLELAFHTREKDELDKTLNTALNGSVTMASLEGAITIASLKAKTEAQKNETARAAADSIVANTENNIFQTVMNSSIASLSQDYVGLGTDGRLSDLQSDLTELPSNLEKAGVHSNMAKALQEESSLLSREVDIAEVKSVMSLEVAKSDEAVGNAEIAQGDSSDGSLNISESHQLYKAEGQPE